MLSSQPDTFWTGGPGQGLLSSLRLMNAGRLRKKTHEVNWSPPTWAVGVVWAGSGWYRAGRHAEIQKASAPFYFFIWAGEHFSYGPHGSWDESFICFSGERCAEWESYGWLQRKNRLFTLSPPVDEPARIHAQILQAVQSNERPLIDRAKCRTEELLCLLNSQQLPGKVTPEHVTQIKSVVQKWRMSLHTPVNLEQEAADLKMSYSHFRRKFREVIGQSPYQYLAGQRVSRACNLLVTTPLSIKEIAARTGFDYTESFNRLFLQQMKQAPGDYRRTQLQILSRL